MKLSVGSNLLPEAHRSLQAPNLVESNIEHNPFHPVSKNDDDEPV
jgi:hypothetical protein